MVGIPATHAGTGTVRFVPLLFAGVLAGVSIVWWALGLPLGIDVSVYRAGASAVVHDESLYGQLSLPAWAPENLPFAYPPFAALLFLPFQFLPVQLAWGWMAVGSTFALWTVVRLFSVARGTGSWGPTVLMGAAVCLQPVWRTLGLGQVNIVLMGLVGIDVLARRGSGSCGVLVGLAAAVKLTPLFFVLHLMLAGRRRDALRAMATFTAATIVGALLLPGDSLRYLSHLFGGFLATKQSWWGNQSLGAVAARLVDGVSMYALHLVLAAVCVGVCVPLVREALRRTDQTGALLISAICALLISPISWTDHWVWAVPLVAYVAACGGLAPRVRIGALVGIGVVFSGVFLLAVPGEPGPWGEAVVGLVYVLGGVAAVALLATAAFRRTRHIRTAPTSLGCDYVT